MGEPVRVRIDGRAMVRPAEPSPTGPFFLSCLDIFWHFIPYNQRLIVYERTCSISGTAVMQQLRSSLALCLVHYYPWCGRIAKDALPPHRTFIDCNDAGVEFVEACCEKPLSNTLQNAARGRFQMNPFFRQLCQCPEQMGDSLYRSPLLSIQATLFSDGGLTLGIAQSHIVADGHSLWNFMVSWGECSRGVDLRLPPLHERERLAVPTVSPEKAKWTFEVAVEEIEECVVKESEKNSCCASVETLALSGEETSPSGAGTSSSIPDKPSTKSVGKPASLITVLDGGVPTHNVGNDTSINEGKENPGETIGPADPDPLVQCLFDLTSSAVKKLKAETGEGFTSFEVMCAHFWQRLTIARQSPECDATHLSALVNCRSRVKPPLSPAYFGNAITFCVARSTVGKIGSESLRATASRIHHIIAETREERIVKFMHWLESNNNHLVFESGSDEVGKGIKVASSPRFPAYQVDFGWGAPVAVRPVTVRGDGELVLFGGRPGSIQGDMEICTALPDSVLRRLLDDHGFLAKPPGSPYARDWH